MERLASGAGGSVRSENEYGSLCLLSPTQAVIERLADFHTHHDGQSIEQALMVASEQEVDLGAVEQWAHDAGYGSEYVFLQQLFEDGLSMK